MFSAICVNTKNLSFASLSTTPSAWNTMGLSYNAPNAYACAELLALGLNKVQTYAYRATYSLCALNFVVLLLLLGTQRVFRRSACRLVRPCGREI